MSTRRAWLSCPAARWRAARYWYGWAAYHGVASRSSPSHRSLGISVGRAEYVRPSTLSRRRGLALCSCHSDSDISPPTWAPSRSRVLPIGPPTSSQSRRDRSRRTRRLLARNAESLALRKTTERQYSSLISAPSRLTASPSPPFVI